MDLTVGFLVASGAGIRENTKTANLGAFCADAGLRTLRIELDHAQPSLSSYYDLVEPAPCGVFELIASKEIRLYRIVSETNIQNLSLIYSNDPHHHLINLLLQAPNAVCPRIQLRLAADAEWPAALCSFWGCRYPIKAVVNRLNLTSDARTLDATIRETFRGHADIQIIDTAIPDTASWKAVLVSTSHTRSASRRAKLVPYWTL